ncbi:acyl-CoA dehydrogenase family protein [Nocardia abscessus]|uniref:acyl-CoA dehydrogenase family protein n=1 Tax=Nocardia abscessus TaxID=120957 RepID=UPI0024553230|nr:acyl-CoA dehydrogenase family protein [Nocardia abscessus]
MSTRSTGSEIRAAAVAVAAVARREAVAADRAGAFAEEALAELRSSGLLGMFVPGREADDTAATIGDYSQVARILGRASLSVAVMWVMHSQQVMTIARYGSDDLRGRVLEQVRRGRNYIGSVTTEPDTGGDLFTSPPGPSARDGRIAIRRTAPIVTGGLVADSFLIKMRSAGGRTPRDTALVYADRSDLEITAGRPWDMLGMRSTGNVALELDGSVPRSNELTVPLAQIAAASFGPLAHVGWASSWLGCAEEAWSRVLRWSGRKRHRAFLDSDSALEEVGRVREHLEIVAACLRTCVARMSENNVHDLSGIPDQIHFNVLKTVASSHCYAAVERMIDLVGLSDGYSRQSELGLERALRDLRAAGLMYSDRRLRRSNGALALLDRNVSLMCGDE